MARTVRLLGPEVDVKERSPKTEPFPKRDLEEERVIEQREGIVADKGKVEESDRPEPNVPHPEDLSMMDSNKTKGR
ncbi:MAG TPA: hypothetical protein VHG53_02640 [Candidatus Limnocylindria bacterium]|nr:hypothetical protein [Candidatus Limnocylindria bacterium]